MMSNGKGIPRSVSGNWSTVTGRRKVKEFRINTYGSGLPDNSTEPTELDPRVSVESKHFVSGNPFVEVTKGILHLYKDEDRLFMEPGSKTPRSEMLCVMAIPASIGCTDLLTFISSFKEAIEHIKIIRDSSLNNYMALLKFKDQFSADTFYLEFNGKPYNSFDENICLVAYVSRVETVKQNNGGGLPLTGHTELPTCPVCLERMDESVDGLLTILCNHSFHSNCLIKWSDNGCPVCRYVQTPEMVAKNACVECNSKEQLWICLICGHVGCGRYLHGHAYKHFCETEHSYAIQPDNNRVWDYLGDNFVHRLYQSKGDGKLVETGRRVENDALGHELEDAEEKVDNMQLEFAHLLTSQLESQRNFFEAKILGLERDRKAEFEAFLAKLEIVESERAESETKLTELVKEKKDLEKRAGKTNAKYERSLVKLDEQATLCNALTVDLNFCKSKLTDVEKKYEDFRLLTTGEIEELKETIRDLSVYIETEKAIASSSFAEEARDGTVSVPIPQQSSKCRRRKPTSK